MKEKEEQEEEQEEELLILISLIQQREGDPASFRPRPRPRHASFCVELFCSYFAFFSFLLTSLLTWATAGRRETPTSAQRRARDLAPLIPPPCYFCWSGSIGIHDTNWIRGSPGAGAVQPIMGGLQGRRPLASQRGQLGQDHGKLLLRHRHRAAGGAVHHGDGRAPVPLPRYQPVPERGAGEVPAYFGVSGLLGDGVKRLLSGEARELHRGRKADVGM